MANGKASSKSYDHCSLVEMSPMPQSRSLRLVDFPLRSRTGCTDSVPLIWTQQARDETRRDKVPLKLRESVPGAMSTEPSQSTACADFYRHGIINNIGYQASSKSTDLPFKGL